MKERIVRNSARCRKCLTEIESKSTHDFVSCDCGDIFVDGGHEYLRRGYKDRLMFEDTSEVYDIKEE